MEYIYKGIKISFEIIELILSRIDWTMVAALISAGVALAALYFQRIDLKQQRKYQRDTFELQNQIDINNKIIDVSSKLLQLIDQQYKCIILIKTKRVSIKKLKENKLFNTSPKYTEESLKLYEELNILISNLSTLKTEYAGTKITLEMLLKVFGDQQVIVDILLKIEDSLSKMYKVKGKYKSGEQKEEDTLIIKQTQEEINKNILEFKDKIDEIQNGIFTKINKIKNN